MFNLLFGVVEYRKRIELSSPFYICINPRTISGVKLSKCIKNGGKEFYHKFFFHLVRTILLNSSFETLNTRMNDVGHLKQKEEEEAAAVTFVASINLLLKAFCNHCT